MKFKYPVYAVIWDDAESDSSWREEHELNPSLKPTLALTFGFLLAEDANYILIGDSYFLEGKVISNTTKIPRGMIREMKEMNVTEKKTKKNKHRFDSISVSSGSMQNGERVSEGTKVLEDTTGKLA